jgi:hypothetical protein
LESFPPFKSAWSVSKFQTQWTLLSVQLVIAFILMAIGHFL